MKLYFNLPCRQNLLPQLFTGFLGIPKMATTERILKHTRISGNHVHHFFWLEKLLNGWLWYLMKKFKLTFLNCLPHDPAMYLTTQRMVKKSVNNCSLFTRVQERFPTLYLNFEYLLHKVSRTRFQYKLFSSKTVKTKDLLLDLLTSHMPG